MATGGNAPRGVKIMHALSLFNAIVLMDMKWFFFVHGNKNNGF